MLTNLGRIRRETKQLKAFMENGYNINAAVVKLVDTPDLGSPHSFTNSSNSITATLCQPTNAKFMSLKSLWN